MTNIPPTQTSIKKISTAARIIGIALLACSVFGIVSASGLVLHILAVGLLLFATGITSREILAALKPGVVIMIVAFIAHTITISMGGIALSWSGIQTGVMSVIRIGLMITYAFILTESVSAVEALESAQRGLQPLKKFKMPVDDLAMVLMVALRFMPVCAQEFERIQTAHKARGVVFTSGSLSERLSKWTSVFVPLLVALFRRSDELAAALRERCYAAHDLVWEQQSIKIQNVAFILVCGLIALLTILCV